MMTGLSNFSTLGRRKQSPNKYDLPTSVDGARSSCESSSSASLTHIMSFLNRYSGLTNTEELAANKWRGGNEQRFMGEGQTFRGKLIGVLEVQEARGDRMCQDALLELKTAIKASGEHKQRVLIHIAVDGLKIRDEKTGDCLYHHPVHKISFIAQDLSDCRAFGYIYGSPENGHRFFGIKTEKAASQVVVAMRDLFQVVFELKKKEMDDAKQQMNKENREGQLQLPKKMVTSVASFPDDEVYFGAAGGVSVGVLPHLSQVHGSDNHKMVISSQASSGVPLQMTTTVYAPPPGHMTELADLQSELEGLQAGIHQITNLNPNSSQSFLPQNSLPVGVLQPAANNFVPQPSQPAPTRGSITRSGRANRSQNQARGLTTDPFGAAPFLPPPPPSKSSRYQHLGGDGQTLYGTLGHPRPHSTNDQLIINHHQLQQQQQQHQQIDQAFQEPKRKSFHEDCQKDRYAAFDPIGIPQVPEAGNQAFGFENSFTSTLNSSAKESSHDFKPNLFSQTLNPKLMSTYGTRNQMHPNTIETMPASHSGLFTDLDPLGASQRPASSDFRRNISPQSIGLSPREPTLVNAPSSQGPQMSSGVAAVPDVAQLCTTTQSSYGYIPGFGFSDYLTEAHPSDRNSEDMQSYNPGNSNTGSFKDHNSAWESHDTTKSGEQSLTSSTPAPDNIYEVCGERSVSQPSVEINIQGSSDLFQMTQPSDSTDPDLTSQAYGSIPHLDASPRRYRYADSEGTMASDSPSSQQNLNVPNFRTAKNTINLDVVSDSPPKLPERPPKSQPGAPPPLPPKKPLSQQSSKTSIKMAPSNVVMMAACFAESVRSDDIYDFPPEPMIGNLTMNQEDTKQCIADILKAQPVQSNKPVMPDLGSVTIEELSRMSVMELNKKMTAGLIPEALKGMSIFELVEFVAKHMKDKEEEEDEEVNVPVDNTPNRMATPNLTQEVKPEVNESMKPSFSDNFVAGGLSKPDTSGLTASTESNFDSLLSLSSSMVTSGQQLITNFESSKSDGFEDDFLQFKLPTSSISGRESTNLTDGDKDSNFDRYAVFRELQDLNDDVSKGWGVAVLDDNREQAGSQGSGEVLDEVGENVSEHPVCSSEGSPRSGSDTGSVHKSVSDDNPSMDDIKASSEDGLEIGPEDSLSSKRESQVAIFYSEELEEGGGGNGPDDSDEEDPPDKVISTAPEKAATRPDEPVIATFPHNFDEAFGPAGDLTMTKDWTTFDDAQPDLTPREVADTNQAHTVPKTDQGFEGMAEEESVQKQQALEQQLKIQEQLHQQHALELELQYHQHELSLYKEELQRHEHNELRYHLLDEAHQCAEEEYLQQKYIAEHSHAMPENYHLEHGMVHQHPHQLQQQVRQPFHIRRYPEEMMLSQQPISSSSDGSNNASPMMKSSSVEKRMLPGHMARGGGGAVGHHRHPPQYANTHIHQHLQQQQLLHQTTGGMPQSLVQHHQQANVGRCHDNHHHWEVVSHTGHHRERSYEDPRYHAEYMSSFGNGNRNKLNRSRHQSSSSELWNSIDEDKKSGHVIPSGQVRCESVGTHPNEGSPFSDNFSQVNRKGSSATTTPSTSYPQPSAEPSGWKESSHSHISQSSSGPTSGDFGPTSDIFDTSRDILSGASFKILAKVVPSAIPVHEGSGQGQGGVTFIEDPMPKSDSVNIFTIKDDPFDDDFFT